MSPLEMAAVQLKAEMLAHGQGTGNQPKEGTVEFYILRGRALAASFLAKCVQDGTQDPVAFDSQYKLALRSMKVAE